ncbi:hypothetical protein MBLNU459_g7123t1 [Dothideomycetes sp. NU459]
MPFACPPSLTRRIGQASVRHHVRCLTHPGPTARPLHSAPVQKASCFPHKIRNHLPGSSFPHAAFRPASARSRGIHNVDLRKRKRNAKRDSLNQALLLAANRSAAPPYYVDSTDISFTTSHPFLWLPTVVDPPAAADDGIGLAIAPGADGASVGLRRTRTTRLQSLLARHIVRRTAHGSESASDHVSTERDLTTLRDCGYDEVDLHTWITVLTSRDTLHAAQLLAAASANPTKTPPFIFLNFLRRQHVDPRALRLLIQHMPDWYQSIPTFGEDVHGLSSSPQYAASDPDVDCPDHTASAELQTHAFRAFLRLLRHTRRVWPEATESLTAHFIRMSTSTPPPPQDRLTNRSLSRTTALLNRALYVLAEPAAVEPFKSGIYQETAQALILRHMADHDPPLTITRDGYRGVTRVQLAKTKTHDEIEWARLKAPSWPPWKEDRTGMDADIGLEHGVSRARQVLTRMQEAGYPLHSWEHTALIYAGWDTDQSPTIQSRALMSTPSKAAEPLSIWAGRIRSTRSVHQAWACFLAYEDEALPLDQDVYLAIFEKLAEETKRLRLAAAALPHPSDDDNSSSVQPGDVKEIFPPPPSSHQSTYTRTEPPTVAQLHQHMTARGLLPKGRMLAFLINSATSIREALTYLESSRKAYPMQLSAMIHFRTVGHRLDEIPDSVFTAYIRLLCRFPHTPLERPKAGPNKFDFGAWDLDLRQPLARAIYLLVQERRQHRPAWNALLEGFARRRAPTVFSNWKRLHMHDNGVQASSVIDEERDSLDRLIAFKFTRNTLSVMQDIDVTLDTVGFRYFCIVTEHAARASRNVLNKHKTQEPVAESHGPALESQDERLLFRARNMTHEAPYVRSQFWTLVSAEDEYLDGSAELETTTLPRLLTTPSPAILHQYVRALGFLSDYDGLRELVCWMVKFWPELSARKAEDKNGEKMMRRVIVSLRVFLEGSWEMRRQEIQSEIDGDGERSAIDDRRGAPVELLDEVSGLVDGVEEWGGWAHDDEVLAYLDRT